MNQKIWAEDILKKLQPKVAKTAERNLGKIPYVATDGQYDNQVEENLGWWTNGFFAGELWQLNQAYPTEIFQQEAEKIEELLDKVLFDFKGLDHDIGFLWLHTAVANYRLNGKETSKIRGLKAANFLAARFHLKGQFIQAWNWENGWTIIDSMMNIPLLYWASEETGNPRYRQVAAAHADTVLNYLVREDGSVGHIASFDPDTGEFIEQLRGQGYAPDSAWSRGQAWALYGFTLSYLHTQDEKYLIAAKRIANYFITHASQTDYLPLVDFNAPYETLKYDASAGVCGACGLLELAKHLSQPEGEVYEQAALKLLEATTNTWVDWDENRDGIITSTSHSYHNPKETHVPIIYGDYFYIEALLRLAGKDFLIW